MFLHISLCAVLASNALANLMASVMMDYLLLDMAAQARIVGLDPSELRPFVVKVEASRFTNREFWARFTHGSLNGLSHVRRRGNCSYGYAQSELKMGCHVGLGSLRFVMIGNAMGDQYMKRIHNITISTQVIANTSLLIEFQASRHSPVRLVPISMRPVPMITRVRRGEVTLNSNRRSQFLRQIHVYLERQLATILTGRYSSVLHSLAKRYHMP